MPPTPNSLVFQASPSPSSSSSSNPDNNSSENRHLKCPRCDSSNTKFCYYNNYNLTQPRYFCKTCRRYWTKGGALRNVPIGGGCRKNKFSVAGKPKSDHVSGELRQPEPVSKNPVLWAAPIQNNHLLSLLRSTLNPNPNANPNFAWNMEACSSVLNRSFQDQRVVHVNGGVVNYGGGDLGQVYQQLRSVPLNLCYDRDDRMMNASSTVMESGNGGSGLWNPTTTTVAWMDVPSSNGAYR